jgi:hypothetical protein
MSEKRFYNIREMSIQNLDVPSATSMLPLNCLNL